MKKILAIIVVLAIILAPATAFAVPLDEFYGLIETHYIEEVDSRALRNVAPSDISEFLNDPYSSYYSPNELLMFMDDFMGIYSGVGIQIQMAEDEVYILDVHPGSPAEKAGIKLGDTIISIDGTPVAGMNLYEVSDLIRGEEGTSVVLEVRRGTTILKRLITREQIDSPTVRSELMGDIGYLWIHTFSDNTPKLFHRELEKLRIAEPRGYIIDLRDNPGGSLAAVLDMAEEFLPAGPMITINDRFNQVEVYGNLQNGTELPNLVVLVNGQSASASEILAGAVQDYAVGTLLGEQTFGKASVQTFFVLSDGSGLKLTTARYLTAKGQAIDKKGLTPHVEVTGYQEQMDAAINLIRTTTSTLVFRVGSDSAWFTSGDVTVDAMPFIEESRSYVPIRLLAETMGASVLWDEEEKTVTMQKGLTILEIPVNGSMSTLDGNEYSMDTPPIIRDDRTFLPARAVAEALGGRVWWDAGKKEVVVAW